MPYDAPEWDIFHIKNKQLIILSITYLIHTIIFNFSIYKCLMKKKVVPKLRQEVKVKVDIVTGDDIKIYYISDFSGSNTSVSRGWNTIEKNLYLHTVQYSSKYGMMTYCMNELLSKFYFYST